MSRSREELQRPQTWSEVVFESRKAASIAEARRDHRTRRRGRTPEVEANASLPAVVAAVGALAGLAAWRREGEALRGRARAWRDAAPVRALLALFDGSGRPRAPTAVRGQVKARPVAAAAAPAPAAAAPPQQQQQLLLQQQQVRVRRGARWGGGDQVEERGCGRADHSPPAVTSPTGRRRRLPLRPRRAPPTRSASASPNAASPPPPEQEGRVGGQEAEGQAQALTRRRATRAGAPPPTHRRHAVAAARIG
jgi:hypothetical protein